MMRSFRPAAGLAAVAVLAVAAPAVAQTVFRYESHERGYDRRYDSAPSAFDWRSQLDRPGDYRCDAYWDANRTDCDARWRDQRDRADRRWERGYGDGYARRRAYEYDHAYGYRYGHAAGGTTYEGAYGRPDHVYPGGGRAYGYGRDPYRIDWCRATYRSYDPRSGYYRTYSGDYVFCG